MVEPVKPIEDLPYPEDDESLLDLNYIHFGYLNCCQILSSGKKVKKERWATCWVDLCGCTLRLFQDKNLPPDAASSPPPASVTAPTEQDEVKVGFFSLENAEADIIGDGRVKGKQPKQSDYPHGLRRHIFQVKFRNMNSVFNFQAPSHSSMLRWVSKVQESIDASNSDKMPFLAEERLKLAKFIMEKKKWQADQVAKTEKSAIDEVASLDEALASDDASSDEGPKKLPPRLDQLKGCLQAKLDLLAQLEEEERRFLGVDSVSETPEDLILRKEFSCPMRQPYYLVPGRMETFLPEGTNVCVFGQLSNRRWRVFVEMDELIRAMNQHLKGCLDLDARKDDPALAQTEANSTLTEAVTLVSNSGVPGGVCGFAHCQPSDMNNVGSVIPDYPLIGSISTSALALSTLQVEVGADEDILCAASSTSSDATPIASPLGELPHVGVDACPPSGDQAPYSSHSGRRLSSRSAPVKSWGIDIPKDGPVEGNALALHSRISESASDDDSSSEDSQGESTTKQSQTDSPVYVRENHIEIKKRLRQRGISILVGSSSSSEDDSDEEISDTVPGIVHGDQVDFGRGFYSFSKALSKQETGSIHSLDDVARKESRTGSLPTGLVRATDSSGQMTTDTSLLRTFGQSSLHVSSRNRDVAKALKKVFDKTEKGPDVKPPRNDRRTLKLSKMAEQGFGFWLQTYGFGKLKDGFPQRRTFVRFVEDEGPAYLAGLREGDIIVEVNGENVEDMDHQQIVEMIKGKEKELILVVKFLDAVRRVELAVRLKKRQAKLKLKLQELENLVQEEKTVLHDIAYRPDIDVSDGSFQTDADFVDIDGFSLNASTSSSEISSLSSFSDDLIVRTSKFEQRSSIVLDSIKEMRYSNSSINGEPRVTTDMEMLRTFSTKRGVDDRVNAQPRDQLQNRLASFNSSPSLKVTATEPVVKHLFRTISRTDVVINLDGDYARELSVNSTQDENIPTEKFSQGRQATETLQSELAGLDIVRRRQKPLNMAPVDMVKREGGSFDDC